MSKIFLPGILVLLAVIVGIYIGRPVHVVGPAVDSGSGLSTEADLLREGALLQEYCRDAEFAPFLPQLARTRTAFASVSPEMSKTNPEREAAFQQAFELWEVAARLIELRERVHQGLTRSEGAQWLERIGEHLNLNGDTPKDLVLMYDGDDHNKDTISKGKIAARAMHKGADAFEYAKNYTDVAGEVQKIKALRGEQ